MYRIVSAVLGYSVLYEDAINWDMERTNAFIGEQLRVIVAKTEKGEKTYNNITEVLSIEEPLPPIEANNEPQNEPSGKEKARAVANSLAPKKKAGELNLAVNNETIAPDIAETAGEWGD